MTELTWKDSGITSIVKMRERPWACGACGNQFELYAALTKHGMDPGDQGVKIFNQPWDMTEFLEPRIEPRPAMTYNELAQVLETNNPETGKL